ncbi:hypothetical protein Pcinc_026060 [Petrolisthes cinctipes]|uniref:Nudix hydrolase domain-containing protein n=1 Tax=Petrolisthes cinctipes TaxID=88211 RepID=A0AAE1F6T7_PETCI|nr:hypothetical protein Pcinc_026060 [Petrolisthes cinctipes]
MLLTRQTIGRLLKVTASAGPLLSPLNQRSPLICVMDSPSLFKGVRDRYSGVTVFSEQEPLAAVDFEHVLQASLHQWREEKVRGVWFRVNLQHADWVPVLAKNGFVYHHAREQFVMMVRWLPINEPNNVPRYAHNVVGVGAFVVTDDNDLLVVRERFYKRPHWKLPGGYVELGENLGEAAVREVKEETGVEAQFVSLVAFRHVHGSAFNCSDLYFIVHLRPTTREITMCETELAGCEWMKLEEYIKHPHVNETNKFFAERFMECQMNGVQVEATTIFHPSFNRDITVYSINSKIPGQQYNENGVKFCDQNCIKSEDKQSHGEPKL